MLARECGVIKRNKYLNFDIIVKNNNEYISNETECLGLLNFNNKKFEVRIGCYVFFYFTDLYG